MIPDDQSLMCDNEYDNLLTKEEARKALLEMLAKGEVRKENELLETAENHEDVEQALHELKKERYDHLPYSALTASSSI